MYALLCGAVPFNGKSDQEVLNKVREGCVKYGSEWGRVSADAKALVRKLLTRNPKERCTAQEALDHDWIKLHAPRAANKLQDGLVDSLGTFRRKNRLKQAALSIVASEINNDQIRHLRETFTALDTNGDGLLGFTEIQAGAVKAGLGMPKELEELFSEDKDAVIDYTEFLAATLDLKSHLSDEVVRTAFGMFDLGNSGTISAEDIAKVFKDLSQKDRQTESEGIITRYAPGKGTPTMDLEQFGNMLRSDCSPEALDSADGASALKDRFSILSAGAVEIEFPSGAGAERGGASSAPDKAPKEP